VFTCTQIYELAMHVFLYVYTNTLRLENFSPSCDKLKIESNGLEAWVTIFVLMGLGFHLDEKLIASNHVLFQNKK
jgi:hypothetical protein